MASGLGHPALLLPLRHSLDGFLQGGPTQLPLLTSVSALTMSLSHLMMTSSVNSGKSRNIPKMAQPSLQKNALSFGTSRKRTLAATLEDLLSHCQKGSNASHSVNLAPKQSDASCRWSVRSAPKVKFQNSQQWYKNTLTWSMLSRCLSQTSRSQCKMCSIFPCMPSVKRTVRQPSSELFLTLPPNLLPVTLS